MWNVPTQNESDITMKLKLALAASIFAVAANAQTFSTSSVNVAPAGKVTVNVGTLTSLTTPKPVAVNPYENVFVSCVGTATSTTQAVRYETSAGRLLASETITCNTNTLAVISRTAGTFAFQQIVISPTAGLSSTAVVTNTIVKTPTVGIR